MSAHSVHRRCSMAVLFAVWTCCGSGTAAEPERGPLAGHDGIAYAVAFTPDGQWIATAGFDDTCKLWDANTREAVRTMEGHSGIVLCIAASPDGTQLASGSGDRYIKLWDVPKRSAIRSQDVPGGGVVALDRNGDGKRLVTGGQDKIVRIWEVVDDGTLKQLHEFTGHTAAITRVAFRSDSQQVASADTSGVIRVFNADNGDLQSVIGAHSTKIVGLSFASNNSYLMSASQDGTVKRWPNKFPEHSEFTGHEGTVRVIAINPNGDRIASAADDKTVRIWNQRDGKELQVLKDLKEPVTTIAYSSNSAQLVTGSVDKIARLFDPNNGNLIKEYPAQAAAITSVSMHPNRQELASADASGVVKIFKTEDASELRTLTGHQGRVTRVAYSPNSQTIVTGGVDKTVRVWSTSDGKEQRKIDVGTPVHAVGVSWNSSQIAAAGDDGAIRIYNLGDGKLVQTFPGFGKPVHSVYFSRDSQRLVSTDDDRATVWESKTGNALQHFVHHSQAVTDAVLANDHRTVITSGADNLLHKDMVSVTFTHQADEERIDAFSISPNSSYHFTTGPNSGLVMWNAGNGSEIRKFEGFEGTVTSVVMSPNSRQVAAGAGQHLYLWDANSRQMQFKNTTPTETTQLAFSPDSKKLIAVGADVKIRSFDPSPLNPQPAEPPSRDPAQIMSGHGKTVTSIVFQPDNQTAWTSSADGTIKAWSVAATGQVADLRGHSAGVYGLAFSPDGKYLASASADKTVRLWDLEKKSQIKTLSTQDEAVYALAFSPDSTHLLTGGGDKTVRLLNVETGAEVRRYNGPRHAIYAVAFRDDGRQIAAGGVGLGNDRTVFLWDTDNPDPLQEFSGHKDDIYSVQFNKSGTRLITTGYAGGLHVWLPGNPAPVYSQDFPQVTYLSRLSPDGTHLVMPADDGKAYFVNIPEDQR
ncbi:WD40 repeat domain-containing protein [Thalassoroseus pseudoceratinae]|uniref:WD40 repeat domain-containing protein n=1 Tax=Thalassoroseus pseudoceratinae TaxID=2713176 RepID=UPI0014206E17|nr:hypothetical protein [Thalassoroseus pseudoceratinae]